mmetsp:Transcript_125601/g.244754  ORF Transcript_125601/g.244754 Transcript_125601/m.244754 type:complete len:95 (-) Transcript_125601:909-1193(-)
MTKVNSCSRFCVAMPRSEFMGGGERSKGWVLSFATHCISCRACHQAGVPLTGHSFCMCFYEGTLYFNMSVERQVHLQDFLTLYEDVPLGILIYE